MIRSCFSGLEMTRNIQDDFRSRQTLSKCDVVTVVEDSYHIRGVLCRYNQESTNQSNVFFVRQQQTHQQQGKGVIACAVVHMGEDLLR